ncbi:MAG TPA: hypothetical protein VI997_02395, partial [Candidatus Thermoplasmatota archaeon]|nr:hypothetical protein [Candidatus Thermoplasmatota archaeon]
MAFSLAAVAFFGAAAVDLALASTLMLAARGRVANRAFAFFLVLVAMVLASLGAGFVVDDAAARDYWARLLWYFGLAD